MEYEDFDLLVNPIAGREYQVTVTSPGGEAKSVMLFPFDTLNLKNRLQALEIALLQSGAKRRGPTEQEKVVLDFGQTLFNALITGEVRGRYDVSWDRVSSQGKGLRIKLRFRSPKLSAIPWEFLWDPRQGEYLGLSTYTPLVRYLELKRSLQSLTVTLPLRILGMIANPTSLPQLDVEVEKQRVERAVADLVAQRMVEVAWLEGQSWRALLRAMRRGPWHIFHFIGHGGFDEERDEGYVVFANRAGKQQRMSATKLAHLLGDHNPLRLVLLNSCDGGQSGQDVFSSTASILVRRGVPSVLAMQYAITDDASIEFSQTFYEAIMDGSPIESAVTDGRKAINLGINNSLEWGTPVLFSHAPDGVLFELTEKPLTTAETSEDANGSSEKPETLIVDEVPEQLQGFLLSGEEAEKEENWRELRGIAKVVLLEHPDHIKAQQWLEEADSRLQSPWPITDSGLPIIQEWSQLDGVDPLPPRIVWEKDGKEMALIPAGKFIMGTTKQEALKLAKEWGEEQKRYLAETPQGTRTLPAYYMDITPVTQAEYALFLADNPNYPVPYLDQGWAQLYSWSEKERQPPNKLTQHPVVLVSCQDARAYSWWAGKLLPSEAQWEKAARGKDDRRYPWGNQWDSKRLNCAERIAGRPLMSSGEWRSWWEKLDRTKQTYTTTVNHYPAGASPYRLLDMSGNVWEWTDSWYQAYPGNETPDDDFGETYRVVRGGSWDSNADNVRTSDRGRDGPENRSSNLGFRCASTPF